MRKNQPREAVIHEPELWDKRALERRIGGILADMIGRRLAASARDADWQTAIDAMLAELDREDNN